MGLEARGDPQAESRGGSQCDGGSGTGRLRAAKGQTQYSYTQSSLQDLELGRHEGTRDHAEAGGDGEGTLRGGQSPRDSRRIEELAIRPCTALQPGRLGSESRAWTQHPGQDRSWEDPPHRTGAQTLLDLRSPDAGLDMDWGEAKVPLGPKRT